MIEVALHIKIDDVYRIQYTDSYREERRNSDLNHCFEGLAVATQSDNGIILVDTFWGIRGGSRSKIFKMNDIGKRIEIEYYCNLNEITKIHPLETKYYSDDDIIFLHTQHACVQSCQYYFVKTGAVRSQQKMLQMLNIEISEAERDIIFSQNQVEAKKKLIAEIEAGKPLNEIYF